MQKNKKPEIVKDSEGNYRIKTYPAFGAAIISHIHFISETSARRFLASLNVQTAKMTA